MHRYCLKRQQVKMAWNPLNCYNLSKRKPLNEKNLNIFQIEWKSKTLCRLYFNGDVTDTLFKRTFNANGRKMHDALAAMERRLDNATFRCMFASSIFAARKMVSDGRVLVNGRRIRFPDYRLEEGDILQIGKTYASHTYALATHSMIRLWAFLPAYFEVDYATLSAIFLRKPMLSEIPSPYPETMVANMAGFYSKRG